MPYSARDGKAEGVPLLNHQRFEERGEEKVELFATPMEPSYVLAMPPPPPPPPPRLWRTPVPREENGREADRGWQAEWSDEDRRWQTEWNPRSWTAWKS